MYRQNETDETLVLLTLAGEQTAYEVLVTRYQKATVASAMAITKNAFMAEDAAQDAFVTAWMKLNTLQEPGKYGSWVCRIAKNCARNMIGRYRQFLPLDVVENAATVDDRSQNPAELFALSEDRREVKDSVDLLPERVRQIIHLHYFEALSIAEIADRMRISEGTVKWQLHDGRKRIRKELCAMNEKYSDTLVQRVMKKVEELKGWQVKNDKSGFEKVYKEVLREVGELPECAEKQHALADVLMRGWWWLPGKKNDALFARIADAAMEGKNEEVMAFIVAREDSKVYGGARIDFMRDKQIPRLEKAGFVTALGREWFHLGHELFRAGRAEEAHAAYDRVQTVLGEGDPHYVLVPYARQMEEQLATRYKDTVKEHYRIGCTAEEYRLIDGALRFWAEEGVGEGYLASVDRQSARVFRNASACDGHFFADILPGETFVGSDGTRLSFLSDSETVDTPAGKFQNCQLWETRRWKDIGKTVCRSYYKDGIGIVRQEHATDDIADVHLLSRYEIKGGEGYLPFYTGNRWEYTAYDPDAVAQDLQITVSFADEGRAILSHWENTERLTYDENSWLDMVQKIANEYACTKPNGGEVLCDVYAAIDRAEQLAATPMERAHTKAAASVARRILATDPTFNPNYTATGHWNFFVRNSVQQKADSLVCTSYNPRWSFEWKSTGGMGAAEEPILYNDILGILQDATNALWSEEWRVGASPIVEYTKWSWDVRTQILCEDGGTLTTKAGTFENCLKLCLDIGGMTEGWSYRGGKKVYYFADGIGIVRTENACCGGVSTAVYELTAYEGVGEGYMPMADGLVRRYEALDLTDGFVGAVEYTYVADSEGDIVIFADRTGIRQVPPPITQYRAIQGEIIEERLWDAGKWQEGHMKYGANNFHLILHLLARPSRNRNNAKRSIGINGFYMQVMEQLGESGEIPPAWYGLYAWTALVKAAALFGDEQTEEGYRNLALSVTFCEKLRSLKEGDLLDTGNKELLGGVKLAYNKGFIQLPDGSKEPIAYGYRMDFHAGALLYAMTAPQGWEWFNSVRNEERFKEYIEQVRKMTNKD